MNQKHTLPHVHAPSGHAAFIGLASTHAVVTLASHWLDHTTEAFLFAGGAVLAACSADIERKWDEYMQGHNGHAHNKES